MLSKQSKTQQVVEWDMSKTIVYVGLIIGSIIGGFIPTLWGAGFLSVSSLIFSTLGALLGIFLVLKYFN
jgi:uncharacterized membrane protein YeaQ/YmgE (transglycosylase-associated protein family)